MQFGSVTDPGSIDFSLPLCHAHTTQTLLTKGRKAQPEVYVGCAKWNRTDLKGFYPKGTKDELSYYTTQFNSIELNATFYNYSHEQMVTWREKAPQGFKFFPKVNNTISHLRRLNNVEAVTEDYVQAVRALGGSLGMVFLQLHDNFRPKDFGRLEKFIHAWPEDVPMALELRNTDWFNDGKVADNICYLLEEKNITNIITDTAGRRDLLHMRLTTPAAFVRYVGANHSSDYKRLDDWIEKLKDWTSQGIRQIYFFVHQNVEKESPLLSAYFIEKLNQELGLSLTVPKGRAEG